jgi:anaphase-promoting complex subunit 1
MTAISACQINPNPNWGKNILEIIGRNDLAQNVDLIDKKVYAERSIDEALDGLEGLDCEVAILRWPKDLRRMEARRILQSYKPVIISLEQGPEVSDHDFVEEQEYFLKRICERTMALPIARGMAALRSTSPLPTEMLSIPPLCLTGKAMPRGTKVELAHIDFPQNMDHWPCFHNGVAAGLRLSAELDSSDIDSVWIAFNRPGNSESSAETEHAGFLMALGLNGHLARLSKSDAFDYLNKGSESISIGLMIGIAASYLGTMDLLVTKKLATQLEALLPPSATELPLSHNTQVDR